MSITKSQKIACGAFLTPYGGMTPCRQQSIAPRGFISRALMVGSLPKDIARPVDWFWRGALKTCVRIAGARMGFLDHFKFDLAHVYFSQLRFLIISEVPAMGFRLKNIKKQPNSPMAIGF